MNTERANNGAGAGASGVAQGRRKATYQVGRLLPKSVRDMFRKQGFIEGAVVTRWPEIVGESMARRSMPTRLSFPRGKRSGGTLHIIVDGPFATELQHFEPLLLEKLNAFYGFGAVARVAITQAPLPKSPKARMRAIKPLSAADEKALAGMIGEGNNADLHDALERLGRQILADDEGIESPENSPPTGQAGNSE